MLGQVENLMVIDSLWHDFEREPDVIDECTGCEEDIHKKKMFSNFNFKRRNERVN